MSQSLQDLLQNTLCCCIPDLGQANLAQHWTAWFGCCPQPLQLLDGLPQVPCCAAAVLAASFVLMLVGDATLPCKHLFVLRFPPFYHTINIHLTWTNSPHYPYGWKSLCNTLAMQTKQGVLHPIIKTVNATVGQKSGTLWHMPYRDSFLVLLHAS